MPAETNGVRAALRLVEDLRPISDSAIPPGLRELQLLGDCLARIGIDGLGQAIRVHLAAAQHWLTLAGSTDEAEAPNRQNAWTKARLSLGIVEETLMQRLRELDG